MNAQEVIQQRRKKMKKALQQQAKRSFRRWENEKEKGDVCSLTKKEEESLRRTIK